MGGATPGMVNYGGLSSQQTPQGYGSMSSPQGYNAWMQNFLQSLYSPQQQQWQNANALMGGYGQGAGDLVGSYNPYAAIPAGATRQAPAPNVAPAPAPAPVEDPSTMVDPNMVAMLGASESGAGNKRGGAVERHGYRTDGAVQEPSVSSNLENYQDPPSSRLAGWNWTPLAEVHKSLGSFSEIPSHIQNFGHFMNETAKKAATTGLTPRDLIKAYAITRSSIQREGRTPQKIMEHWPDFPGPKTGVIRPEGAMGEWLQTPMGQRYLDAAVKGNVDHDAVKDAIQSMKAFGLSSSPKQPTGEQQYLPYAAQMLPGQEKHVSDMVARAIHSDSAPQEWRDWAMKLSGIKYAKAGFLSSLLGRGDQPTADAREYNVHSGMTPGKERNKLIAKGQVDPVLRLAARHSALNIKMPSELQPHYQHLVHHAVWEHGGEPVTHEDIINAMRHAASGGEIDSPSIHNHILVHAMRAAGLPGLEDYAHGGMVGQDPQKAIRRATMVAKSIARDVGPIPSQPAAPAVHPASMVPGVHVASEPQHFAEGGDVQPTDDPTVQKALGVVRKVTPQGLYSQGAEAAAALPQAKGSPQQFKSTLMSSKYNVKPTEFQNSGFDEAFANRPSVTKDEVAQHFQNAMPQIKETVLGVPHKDLKHTWNKIDQLSNELYDAGITEHTPIVRGTYNPEFYPPEYHNAIKQLADAHKYVREQADLGRTMAVKPTKYGKYTLPGGENYREVLLKSPEQEGGTFKSSHWDDPNVLAHLRLADRTGPNGEKILHVEEIQSDWGQEGKKKGFKIPLTPELENSANAIIENKLQPGAEFMHPSWRTKEGKIDPRAIIPSYVEFLKRNGTISPDEARTLQSWNNARGFYASGVPSAPYVTSTQGWTDLALKRALKEAAKGGYDKLIWTPGAEQAKRYDLSKQVSRVYLDNPVWHGDNDVRGNLIATGLNGNDIISKPVASRADIEALIGKEPASKLIDDPSSMQGRTHVLEGQDLSVGGEGMKGYYDKIVPKRLQELVKKHDPEAKIETHNLITKKGEKIADEAALNEDNELIEEGRFWDDAREENVSGYRVTSPGGQELGVFDNLPDAHNALLQALGNAKEPDTIIKVPSLKITPKMRASILKGQPAFKHGGTVDQALSLTRRYARG